LKIPYVSSLIKGVEYIEEALLNLSSNRRVHLIDLNLVGFVPNLTEKFKIIEFGWMNETAKIDQALNAADVFLMSSRDEAFSMMAVESMSCGISFIVFEGAGFPSVIQAPCSGIAVPSNGWKALKAAFEALIRDIGLYKSLVRNGLEVVSEEHTFDTYAARHLDLYNQLISL
jgi:glycosyltransferase involved in cell wall biosynthesis